MSKSNKEKQRLTKIRAFENGDVEFDTSMLKLKLNFYLLETIDTNKTIKTKINYIDNELKFHYEEFYSSLFIKHLKYLKIYDVNIHFEVKYNIVENGSPLESNPKKTFIDIMVSLYSGKTFICKIKPLGLKTTGDTHHIRLFKNIFLNTFEVENNVDIHTFLKTYISKSSEIYQNADFFQIIQIRNCGKTIPSPCNYMENKRSNILYKSHHYKHVRHLISFISNNKNGLGIKDFVVRYDFAQKEYDSLALEMFVTSDSPPEWFIPDFIADKITFKTNLDVFHFLKKNNFIKFEIDNLAEDEIIEMFPILNY